MALTIDGLNRLPVRAQVRTKAAPLAALPAWGWPVACVLRALLLLPS